MNMISYNVHGLLLIKSELQGYIPDYFISNDRESIRRRPCCFHTSRVLLKDVHVLNEHWDQWDDLSDFELGKGGEQRVLIVASNNVETAGDSQQEHTSFSADSHRLLAARQVVAMTTLTLCKIYLRCKKNKDYTKTIFQPIENHPGGVVRV